MIEILARIGNWFARNGSASDWFTSFGTVGAVVFTMFNLRKREKLIVDSYYNGKDYVITIENRGNVVSSIVKFALDLEDEEYEKRKWDYLKNPLIIHPSEVKAIDFEKTIGISALEIIQDKKERPLQLIVVSQSGKRFKVRLKSRIAK